MDNEWIMYAQIFKYSYDFDATWCLIKTKKIFCVYKFAVQ